MNTHATGSVDEDMLAACVSCGLCLPHCPTYRVTGEELASPRGRIALMRQVHLGGAPIDDTFLASIDGCVQCRGCESACPSGVRFGALMEQTRTHLVAQRPATVPRWQRLAYWALGHHRLVLAGSRLAALAQRAHLLPGRLSARLGLPARLPVRQGKLTPSGNDVWLFTGCVMDAWQRDIHAAAKRVAERTGAGVALPGRGGDCCGALHAHAGLHDQARRRAAATMASMPGDAPILVDSAGCGAAMKEYSDLFGTPEAERFSARVRDVHEWLAERLDRLPAPRADRRRPVVAVHDPCHLRHVQKAHAATRRALAPYVELRELDDDGLCCGAGGAYAALHPAMADAIRARKLDAIERTGASEVASANPGCALHLAAAGVRVRHPIEYIAEAIDG